MNSQHTQCSFELCYQEFCVWILCTRCAVFNSVIKNSVHGFCAHTVQFCTVLLRILCSQCLHTLCSFEFCYYEFCLPILYTHCTVLNCAIQNSVYQFSTPTVQFLTAPFRPVMKSKHSSTQRGLRALSLAAILPQCESDHSLQHTAGIQNVCKCTYTHCTFFHLEFWTSHTVYYSEQIPFQHGYFFPSSSKVSEDIQRTASWRCIFWVWPTYCTQHSLLSQYFYVFCPTKACIMWRTYIQGVSVGIFNILGGGNMSYSE